MLFGRIEDKRETEAFVSSLPQPLFSLAPNEQSGAGQDIFLWQAEEKIVGTVSDPHLQEIGDCVSHALGLALDTLRWIRMLWEGYGDSEEWVETATEPIYGGSRIQIGEGRVGNQDGTMGAWAIKWVMDYGVIPRAPYPNLDLSQYSGNLARYLGTYGCPPNLFGIAKEFPVRTTSLVTSYTQLRDLIAVSKSPAIVCSTQGFEPFIRGNDGFISPGGHWPHSMPVIGVTDNPIRPGVIFRQSWGPGAPSGPLNITLPHGLPLQLYEGMFLVDAEVVDSMLQGEDSFGISDMVGYQRKEIPDLEFY